MILPRLPLDSLEFERSFLPFKDRVVGRDGVTLHRMYYRGRILNRLRNTARTRVRIKYDPEDIREVYLFVNADYHGVLHASEKFRQRLSLPRWKAIIAEREERYALYEVEPNSLVLSQQREMITRAAKRQIRDLKNGTADFLDDVMDANDMVQFL